MSPAGRSLRLLRYSSRAALPRSGPVASRLDEVVARHEADAATVICVAARGRLIGVIAVADTLKADAKAAIAGLRAQGIASVMITGDNRNCGGDRARARLRDGARRGAAAGQGRGVPLHTNAVRWAKRLRR